MIGKTLGKIFTIFNENQYRLGMELIDMFLTRYNEIRKNLGKINKEVLVMDLTFTLKVDESYPEKLLLLLDEFITVYNLVVKNLEDDAKLVKKEIYHELEVLRGYVSVISDLLIGLINHEQDLNKFR